MRSDDRRDIPVKVCSSGGISPSGHADQRWGVAIKFSLAQFTLQPREVVLARCWSIVQVPTWSSVRFELPPLP